MSQQHSESPPWIVTPLLNDPRLSYSEYVCLELAPKRVSFERPLHGGPMIQQPFCLQEKNSPGARLNFRTDARSLRLELDYLNFAPHCLGDLGPLNWEFGLEIDGELRPIGSANPLHAGGTWSGTRFTTPWVQVDSLPGAHDISVIWPGSTDVDLVGLQLRSGSGSPPPQLFTPPERPGFLVGTIGDSLTHGLFATHVVNSYPARFAAELQCSVVNLGFSGRRIEGTDARTAALPAQCFPQMLCAGQVRAQPVDMVVLSIGSNDFNLPPSAQTSQEEFETLYGQWLDEFRCTHATTPILCITPLPRGDECYEDGIDLSLEQYRESIRTVLGFRDDPNLYLFEGRDLMAAPPTGYHVDGLHLDDQGYQHLTTNLSAFNLIRNGSFELKPFAPYAPCPSTPVEVEGHVPYLWDDIGAGPALLTTTSAEGARALALPPGGAFTQTVLGLSEDDEYSLSLQAMTDSQPQPGAIVLDFLSVSGQVLDSLAISVNALAPSWGEIELQGTAPPNTASARMTLAHTGSAGTLFVDDIRLLLTSL